MSSSDGSCPHHPAIRLKRYNRRTNEWKTLLETCPLCASGLPSTLAYEDDNDDAETVSSRSSRFSRSAYSAATTHTGTTMNTLNTGQSDVTYQTDSKSLSSMSTRKQRNSSLRSIEGEHIYGRYEYDENDRPYTDDEGYKTEDNEESLTDLDSSGRSGVSSKGVRFGPGTKEASEAGTDLDSEVDLDEERVSTLKMLECLQ
jgi:hypothetical protein